MFEHSPLGGSGMERWSECPGSVALSKTIAVVEEEEPDYRRDGMLAHTLGAYCLDNAIDAWEVMDRPAFEAVTAEMADAVQMHLDYVRRLPGEIKAEVRVSRPEFHPLFHGTLDVIVVDPFCTHIVDYKYGVGVVVEVKENPQLLYYAYGYLGNAGLGGIPDSEPVFLHIVQPRAYHPNGPIRVWETTAGYVRAWARDVLLPAMRRVDEEQYLSVGPWCRFCPAKVVCPAMTGLAKAHAGYAPEELKSLDEATLGRRFEAAAPIRMYLKALGIEVQRRLQNNLPVPGAKLVRAKTDRVWKEGAVEALFADIGEDLYTPPAVKSPAQVEKLGAKGKALAQEWAYKPEGSLTAVVDSDPRPAVAVSTMEETFGAAIKGLTTVAD
jgi:Protein of unknown function (DUF2800)